MIEITELIRMYEQDELSYDEIAVKVGKSSRWVGKKLKGHIIPRPSIRRKITHPRIEWGTKNERDGLILKYYQEGIGAFIISKRLGIGKRTVFRTLKNNDVPIDKSRRSGSLNKDEVNSLYDSGMASSQIAKKFNMTPGSVRHHIQHPRNNSDALSAIPIVQQDQVLSLLKEGWSTYRVADELSLNYQSIQHFAKRKGVSVGSGTIEWKRAVQRGIRATSSRLEKAVEVILRDLDIDYEPQYQLEEFRYDFAVDDGNILIETQGSYWHSKPQRIQRDRYKSRLAKRHNKKLIVIWDYELAKPDVVRWRITNAVNPVCFDFRQCQVEMGVWIDIKEILNKYHYQGAGRSGLIVLARTNGAICAGAIFTRPVRQEIASKQGLPYDQVLELSRLIIVPQYQARNFASWFLARAIKQLPRGSAKLLVAFSDPTFGHIGTVYRASNWTFDGETPASYWYYHSRKNQIYHKKTIWNAAKLLEKSESEHAASKHLIKVRGQKKLRYLKWI